jgi:tripartite-type tricarboxylate transporter receptor subunit TctC
MSNAVRVLTGLAMMALLCLASGVNADSPRQITILIASDAGGGYDFYGRLVALHLGQFLPGDPLVTPSNMPGAGGLTMMNYLYHSAPRDGSYIGIPQNNTAFEPLFGDKQARFDANQLNWLGSLNSVVNIVALWHTVPVHSVDDLFQKELLIAGEAGTDGTITARLLNQFTGTRFKLVLGYPGTSQILLAVSEGEADGTSDVPWDVLKSGFPDLLRDNRLRIMMQVAPQKAADLPDVPFALDYVKSAQDKAVFSLILAKLRYGRPFVAPPGVPEATVRQLRDAFARMSRDKAFLADAAKQRLEINPTGGAEMQKFIATAYKTPDTIVEKAKDALRRAGAIGIQ